MCDTHTHTHTFCTAVGLVGAQLCRGEMSSQDSDEDGFAIAGEVDYTATVRKIATEFDQPGEIVREVCISNPMDAGATHIRIFPLYLPVGSALMVVDDGHGMDRPHGPLRTTAIATATRARRSSRTFTWATRRAARTRTWPVLLRRQTGVGPGRRVWDAGHAHRAHGAGQVLPGHRAAHAPGALAAHEPPARAARRCRRGHARRVERL